MENKAQNARHPFGWRAFLTQFYAKSLDFKAVIPYEGSPKLLFDFRAIKNGADQSIALIVQRQMEEGCFLR